MKIQSLDLFSDQNPPAVGLNAKHHCCDPQPNFTCSPWRSKTLGPEIQQYPSTNQCIQTQPSGSLFSGTLLSQRRFTRIRSESHLFFGEFVGIPFIYVTRRSIVLPCYGMLRCQTCQTSQTARSFWAIAHPVSTPDAPCAPGSSALLLRPTPTASTRTEPLAGLAWPAARSRHTFQMLSVPAAPGGLHPTRLCAGRSGTASFARMAFGNSCLIHTIADTLSLAVGEKLSIMDSGHFILHLSDIIVHKAESGPRGWLLQAIPVLFQHRVIILKRCWLCK